MPNTATGRDRCDQCEATGADLAATPLGQAMAQWADVVLTVAECDHEPATDDDGTPTAPARFEPPNSLVIDRCPFCSKRHVHGAGAPAPGTLPGPDMYGNRTAHCRRRTSGPARTYRLVPAERPR